MRSPDDPSAPAPAATHEPAGPLDRDAVRDGDLSNAAFGIFGLAGLAIVAVASVWFLTRPGADEDVGLDRLFATENAPVPADAPMLRSGFDLDSVPHDRLGVRESIIGRMERAGGSAHVHRAPGGGTEIALDLPIARRAL